MPQHVQLHGASSMVQMVDELALIRPGCLGGVVPRWPGSCVVVAGLPGILPHPVRLGTYSRFDYGLLPAWAGDDLAWLTDAPAVHAVRPGHALRVGAA
jgi:hypothetical protein